MPLVVATQMTSTNDDWIDIVFSCSLFRRWEEPYLRPLSMNFFHKTRRKSGFPGYLLRDFQSWPEAATLAILLYTRSFVQGFSWECAYTKALSMSVAIPFFEPKKQSPERERQRQRQSCILTCMYICMYCGKWVE